MSKMCLIVTPAIEELANKIRQEYPEACERNGFNNQMCAEWIGLYNDTNSKNPDDVPAMKSLINFIEKLRNKEGKSFLSATDNNGEFSTENDNIQMAVGGLSSKDIWRYAAAILPMKKSDTITFTPTGKAQQVYTIVDNHIYNKEGKEVFTEDSRDRNRIFANLAVKQGRAVVVTYRDRKYVVNNRKQIISASGEKPGNIMQWGEENGDRKAILNLAEQKFRDRIIATKESSSALNEELLDYLQLIGLDIHYEEEMDQYLREHGDRAVQEIKSRVPKYNKNDVSAFHLRRDHNEVTNDILTPYEKKKIQAAIEQLEEGTVLPNGMFYLFKKSKILYKLNTSKAQYDSNRKLHRDGFEITERYNLNNLTEQQFENFINRYNNDKERRIINRWLQDTENEIGSHVNSDVLLQDRKATGYDARLDEEALSGKSIGKGNLADGRNDKGEGLREDLITEEGEVKGFATPEGSLYFDRTIISPEHSIHEYTHLWDRVVAKNNPKLWQRGIELMKKTSLWKEYEEDENYGKKWEDAGVSGSKLESLIASEVHARLVGVNGEQNLDKLENRENKGIINKLKQWLLDFWKDLKATFSNWSQEEINKLTLQDFTAMTIRDLADGFNPNTFSIENNPNQFAQQPVQQAPVVSQEQAGGFSFTQEELAQAKQEAEEREKQIPRPLSPSYETALKAPTSEQKELYNAFSPEQIVDRGRMISSMFSEILDDTIKERREYYQNIINDSTASQEDKENARRSLETYYDPILARQAAVNFRTYSGIVQEIKEKLEQQIEYATDAVKKQKLENTTKYFDLLMNEASKWIEEEEGIRKGKENTTEEEEQDDQDFGDNDTGNASKGNDGWSFQERFNNPFRAISKQVKRVLNGIETGEVDDLGNSKTYSQGYIYSALMSYLSKNLESADDFMQLRSTDDYEDGAEDIEQLPIDESLYPYGYPTFPALEAMVTKYPWAKQVIARLTKDWRVKDEDDSTQLRYPPTYGALASQFYTNFRKAFIPYAKIQVGINPETNKPAFGTTPLNYDMEDRSQRDELENSYNNGITYSPDSLYNTDKTLNKENAKKVGDTIASLIEGEKMSYLYTAFYDNMIYGYEIADEYKKQAEDILNVLRAFGINATKNNVASLITEEMNAEKLKGMLVDLQGIASQVEKLDANKNYFLDVVNKYGKSVWEDFFQGRGFITETNLMQSFYDPASKKTRYSYSADNYLQRTMRFLFSSNISKERRQQYLDEHFGGYEWFRDQTAPQGQGWKSLWLERAYNSDDLSSELPYKNINSTDTVTPNGDHIVHDYSNWDASDKYRVKTRSWDTGSGDFAYYLSPIFADSPMSMTVRGPKFSLNELIDGTYDASGRYIPSGFVRLIDQELQRIKYINDRAKAIKDGKVLPITNYEKNGKKFCFIPELNERMFGAEGNQTFIEYINQLTEEYDISPDKVAGAYNEMIRNAEIDAIKQILEEKYMEFIHDMPQDVRHEITGNTSSEDISDEEMVGVYEVPYYNMVYANIQIVELTTVDTAFYKNSTDFQKRFKEVYASGGRLNTNSRYGKKFERVILLSDELVTSRSYNNIKKVIDNAGNRINKSDRDYILSCFAFMKDKKQDGINISDAQALRSLSSYRAILDMMGKWDERTEAAYHRIINGEWNRADFDIVLQTLKPFVYTVISKNDGLGGKIAVPVQHKNSELVMLAMYDMISGDLKNSTKLKAINKFLEETKDAEGNPIADMIQFESAGKSGNQGVININYSHSKVMKAVEDGEIVFMNPRTKTIEETIFLDDKKFKENTRSNSADNFDEIKTQLTHQLDNGKMTQETFDRCMSYFEPSEEEIIETLETYATIKDNGGRVAAINPEAVQEISYEDYMIVQPTPEHHMEATVPQGSQGRNIIVADLPDDFKLTLQGKGKNARTMSKEELIDFYYELIVENLLQNYVELRDVFKDANSLRERVIDLARNNPTYGRDFVEAFSVKSDGNFELSPNSPTIFRKVQQLVNSVIKNAIAIQKVNGAALIQASGIGLSNDLRLLFDKNGKPKGAECYLPATSRRFFEAFIKKETINGQEVDVLDVEALQAAKIDKAVGFRIPTENKSSMLPIIIKGFSPQQNGSTIFLPAEITALAGSDFDVDKLFVMLSDFYVQEYDKQRARRDFAKTNSVFNDILSGLMKAGNLSEEEMNSDEMQDWEDDAFKEWWSKNKENYRLEKPIIHKAEYDFSKSPKENGRKARNTMLVQMMHNILTSQEGAENLFNPQHFRGVIEASDMMQILQDRELLRTYMEKKNLNEDTVLDYLYNDSPESLADFIKNNAVERSPVYPQTFDYFHTQNTAGDALLAMFALQVSAAAKFQRANITIKDKNQFTINGRKIIDTDKIFNGLGEHRLKNVSQFVGACADNGKNPKVTNYGATRNNAKMIAYLLRAGLSIKEAALVINQPLMQLPASKLLKQIDIKRSEWKDSDVTSAMLMQAIYNPAELSAAENQAIAIMCYKVKEQSDALAELTSMSRADSPNGGLPETFAKARIYKYKVDLFNGKQHAYDFPFNPIEEAISNDKINLKASEDEIRQQLLGQRMSMLQGFYSLGVQSFDTLMSPFFFMLDKNFDTNVTQKVLNNLPADMTDENKAKVLDALYSDYITYALSGFALFGDENDESTLKSKREYYLKQFPKDYQRILAENPEIRDAIGNLLVLNKRGRIVLRDAGQRGKGQKEDIIRRITSLLYQQNPETQEVANKLVKDLFAYSYFDNGLQFTSDSFSTMFSTQLCTSIDGYNEFLQGLGDNIESAGRFIRQFFNNHPEIAVSTKNKIRSTDEVTKDKIIIDRHHNHAFDNPIESGIRPYAFINDDGNLYILESFDNDFITYVPIPRFGDSAKLYNSNMNIQRMADEFPYVNRSPKSGFDEFLEQAFDPGMNPDFNTTLDGNVQMFIQKENIPTESYSTPNVEQSSSDNYDAEGRNQLGAKPC